MVCGILWLIAGAVWAWIAWDVWIELAASKGGLRFIATAACAVVVVDCLTLAVEAFRGIEDA